MNKPPFAAALLSSATLAAALSLGLAGPAHSAEKSKNTVSRELAKPLKAAQEDEQKGRYREAIDKLMQANANPKKTPFDQHVINELLLYAYIKTKDYADAVKPMEATIDDGFTEPAQVQNRIRDLGVIYYQLKNYDKAIQYGERAVKGGFGNDTTYTLVSQAYYLKGDYKDAVRFTNNYVDQEVKNGGMPKEQQLQIVLNSCVKLSDQQCASRTLERLVTYYPKPEYWQDLINTLYVTKEAENNDADMLAIYELANDVGALKRAQDYIEMAQLALEQGLPGEAQQVLEKGIAQNLFADQQSRQRSERLFEKAKKAAATDQASLARQAQDAAAAATGDKDVAVGEAYLSYQKYDQAVEALRRGIMKDSLKNPARAQLMLGMAELKAGNKDAALKAFHDVKASDPVLQRLANLWTVHAREQGRTVASR